MTTYTCSFKLPASRARVFAFFTDVQNLSVITPPWVHLQVVMPTVPEIHQGATIDYRLRMHGIPFSWRSEITAWQPPARFVDEQRRGPYKVWIHEHHFQECDGATQVDDRVTYATAGGRLVERFLVAPKIRRIFAYRQRRLEEIFGAAGHAG